MTLENFIREASTVNPNSFVGNNQRDRDKWVEKEASMVPKNAVVLDIGAGTCPYRKLFSHCTYKTHDFMQYEGEKLGGTSTYGHIDYVSDITAIPAEDSSFDTILCTEVLEHVPEPIKAVKEFGRLIRPGGTILITAPLHSGIHQEPYHYYGGFTPYWYHKFLAEAGFTDIEIVSNGGFFKLLGQECWRVASTLSSHSNYHQNPGLIGDLFGRILPAYLNKKEAEGYINTQFTIGYHVKAVKTL